MEDDCVVVEEREELMVSPTGGDEFLKKAHFLTPSVSSSAASPSVPATAPAAKCKHLPLKVIYHGWKRPPENWISWVDQLYSSHNSTWKRAGVVDAIVASKCFIPRSNHLILELVEKWCPKTNSFVFPWGEASITLEDIMVLGGYPVLGESVLISPENEEMVKKLETARSTMNKSKSRSVYKEKWVAQFKGSGSEIEHAAFLSYWLSRFVFPSSPSRICGRVIPIAVHLAIGTQIALAPALLATIYQSLTILKASMILARTSGKISEFLQVSVPAPLAIVQVWIWERFPSLRPTLVPVGRPRLARWDRIKLGSECKSLSIGKDFQWRPYMENEGGVDLEGFVRCVRTCELVSLEGNSMEQYLPHRVAMQFGMDQDIPGDVQRVNSSWEIAWKHYNRPIRDTKVYVPPRFSEPHVSSRYLTWWRRSEKTNQDLFGRKSEVDVVSIPPPGFSIAWKRIQQQGVRWKSPSGLNIKMKFVASSSSGGRKSNPKSCKRRRKLLSGDNSNGFAQEEANQLSSMPNNGNICNQVDEGILEERILIAEKLVAFLEAGKLVCL